ncbi:spore protease YyaC [Ammoniphilus sp. YIM 78166]|uniref:spore protease YyaC n=1 Tax=Ammoniphilus sp. YIM 78166 TaxID=1644106 RepID=UPI001430DBF7|nr:spore protease YyaC [Ammoniphilus sp. YIM 78166]
MLKQVRQWLFPKRQGQAKIKTEQDLLVKLADVLPSHIRNEDVVFFCIGTNQISGDCFGPLVGSYLKSNGYTNVMGTIQDPIDAKNIHERIQEIPKDKLVIAIDAALGTFSFVETFSISSGTLHPGSGIGKTLPPVGDVGIVAVVNLKDWKSDSLVLTQTSLSTVIPMVITLSSALMKYLPCASGKTVNLFEEDMEVRAYLKRLKGEYYSPLLN